MSKTLFILNTFYPYSRQEDFLANEIRFIEGFDRVVIFPNSIFEPVSEPLYTLPDNVICVPNRQKHKFHLLMELIYVFSNIYFYKEIWELLRHNRITFSRLTLLVSFLRYSLYSYSTVSKYIKSNDVKDDIYVYSYWLHASAFVGCYLKKRYKNVKKVISRCHRFDLYEYANKLQYIPMRDFIFSTLDEVHSISEDGVKYLSNTYPKYSMNIVLSRLGTFDYGFYLHKKNDILKIASCSWMRKVKRVHLIYEAIKDSDYRVEWTHYGSGDTFDQIKELIDTNCNSNVVVHLAGSTTNDAVLKSYLDGKFDIFVNVSENEGVPVSIMEAMSCGLIPVATNVGGTGELIRNKATGFLLPKDFQIKDLTNIFNLIHNMSDSDRNSMVLASRSLWEKYYNADKNYSDFYKKYFC